MKKSITDWLEDLAEHVPWHVINLNNGGCGVFAHLVGDRIYRMALKGVTNAEFLGYVVNGECTRIIKSDSADKYETCKMSIDELRPYVTDRWSARSWFDAGLTYVHIGVELRIDGLNYLYDSNGLHLSNEHNAFLNRVPGYLERTELMLMALQQQGWSRLFDRGQMPFLKRIVNAFIPYPDQVATERHFRSRIRKQTLAKIEDDIFGPRRVKFKEIRNLIEEIDVPM